MKYLVVDSGPVIRGARLERFGAEQLVTVPEVLREVRDPAADVAAAVRTAGLRFPVVCKPIQACGTVESHQLAVVMREAGLRTVRPPVLVQEYVNHGGQMLKCYFAAGRVHVATRPSLPDLRSGAPGTPAAVRFDSQRMPLAEAFGECCERSASRCEQAANSRTRTAEVESIVRRAASCSGVRLMGVDVVVASDGACLVVDANYFPFNPTSFPGLAEALAELVSQRACPKRRR